MNNFWWQSQTMFIKEIFKDSKKMLKDLKTMCQNESISVFSDKAKFGDLSEKMLMWAELKGCATWFLYILGLFQVRYNCAKIYNCRICVTYFRDREPFCPPSHPLIREKPRKCPSSMGLNILRICLESQVAFYYYTFIFTCAIWRGVLRTQQNIYDWKISWKLFTTKRR